MNKPHALLCKCLECLAVLDVPVAKALVSENLLPGVVGVDTVVDMHLSGLRQRNTSENKHLPTHTDNTVSTSKEDDIPVWFYTGKNKPSDRKKNAIMAAEVKRMARKFTPDAMQTLYDIMLDKTTSALVRAKCAIEILDRSVGKTRIADTEGSDDETSEQQISDADLEKVLNE